MQLLNHRSMQVYLKYEKTAIWNIVLKKGITDLWNFGKTTGNNRVAKEVAKLQKYGN